MKINVNVRIVGVVLDAVSDAPAAAACFGYTMQCIDLFQLNDLDDVFFSV